MKLLHLLDCLPRGNHETGPPEADFKEPQIGQGNNAGEKVASDFPVCPVTQRHDADQIIVFTLPEGFLDYVPVETCTYDLVRRPVLMVGNQNVFAKLLDVAPNPIIVLSENES